MMHTEIEKVIDSHKKHVNSGMARLMNMLNVGVESVAEGAYIFDHDNNRYLDCGGYCVFLLGQRHPRLLSAITSQLENIALSSRLLVNQQVAKAADALVSITPEKLQYVWFANSGAEAVEAAIKLCKINGKSRFIAMQGGFHGKTTGALSLTHNTKYRDPFMPLMPGVTFASFGDIESLRKLLLNSEGEAAVILEPIQSEAGVIIPSEGYLKTVEGLCRDHNALLVIDEISTGLGRTGEWWYCQSENVTPDILLCGKALSGGLVPVSALVCTPELYQQFNTNPLLHTSTFSGSPLVSSVVYETINLLKDLDAPARSREIGSSIVNGINSVIARGNYPFIREIRARGLLIALEFHDEASAGEFLLSMLQNQVIVSHSLNAHVTVRLTPSLCLSENDISYLIDAVETSLTDIKNRYYQ